VNNPSFDKDAEDAANAAAARAIGLHGTPIDWTWENWMAIEAERGLLPTCYSCLILENGPGPDRQTAAWDAADPRLRMGGVGTSEAIANAAVEAGLGTTAAAIFRDQFGDDYGLRAYVSLILPGHQTASEMLAVYPELLATAAEGRGGGLRGGQYVWDLTRDQGGYAPTPPTAYIDDQLFMVGMSARAVCVGMPEDACEAWLDNYEGIEGQFLSEWRTTPVGDVAYGEWLRRGDSVPSAPQPSTGPLSAAYEVIRLGPEAWTWSTADDLSEDGRVVGSARIGNRDVRIFLWEAGTIVDLSDLTDLRGAFYADFADDGSIIVVRYDGPPVVYRPDTGTFAPYEEPDLTDLPSVDPPPGFAEAEVNDVNRRGELAGTLYPVSVDDLEGVRGFVASNGDVTVLGPAPGGDTSEALMITEAGQVIGGPLEIYENDRPYLNGRAFLYDLLTEQMTDLGTVPGFAGSFPLAMNTAGDIVGQAWRRDANGQLVRRAFLYDPVTATMVDLNDRIPDGSGWVLTAAIDINEAGQIVGEGAVGGRTQAFLLNP
jgi:probable HAF family extracellular repeat protein